MKFQFSYLAATVLALQTLPSLATVRYVNVNSTSPTPPFTNWATAATIIQDAVDVANPGDQIFVTNGVYQMGGRVVYRSLTNRVAINKAVTVQSINGSAATIIQGNPVFGDSAVRCVYLTNQATLIGFTLTNGATRASGDLSYERSGGGAWCESTSAIISNCVLTANSASMYAYGGGAYSGTLDGCTLVNNSGFIGGGAANSTLNNCTLMGNSASDFGGGAYVCVLNNCLILTNSASAFGGAYVSTLTNCIVNGNSAQLACGGAGYSTLNNCTVTGNSGPYSGGGVTACTLNNSIVYYNSDDNFDSSCTVNFSCTTPDPGGAGNITSEPLFVNLAGGDLHLQSNSPCINTGNNAYVTVTNDLDGNPRIVQGVVDMGAYEFQTGVQFLAHIEANRTNAAVGFSLDFTGLFLGGLATSTVWDFGDGTTVSNQVSISHSWASVGVYPVVLTAFNDSNPGGISATVTVYVAPPMVCYVNVNGTNPVSPYSSRDTAATNIQDAVDVAVPNQGSLVLVTNGLYQTGGRIAIGGTLSNRVVVAEGVTVQSVNGPAATIIQGYQVPGTTNDFGAVRCVYLADGAILSGFTLTNGATIFG
ncbi:MAG TPA: choice-of-anchor Q domain-containing protein, partial [Verrucomicrobiae bacterium]|nr:choice-of-anchor Q domain-containing protein [Verrucomicrobiae bacterium]